MKLLYSTDNRWQIVLLMDYVLFSLLNSKSYPVKVFHKLRCNFYTCICEDKIYSNFYGNRFHTSESNNYFSHRKGQMLNGNLHGVSFGSATLKRVAVFHPHSTLFQPPKVFGTFYSGCIANCVATPEQLRRNT